MFHFYFNLLLLFHFTISDSKQVTKDSVFRQGNYSVIDTTQLVQKQFSSEVIQKLKKDDELNYKEPPTVAESWWERFKNWLSHLLEQLLEGATTTNLGRAILYLIAVAVAIAIIMMLVRVNATRVFFSRADQGKDNHQVFEEDIHGMDFEKLTREAIDRNDFRNATRLVFLYALKILSDKQLIDWLPGKTNHDYLEELTQPKVKIGFRDLSYYFDYAWYGNFNISATLFQKIENSFRQWKKEIE